MKCKAPETKEEETVGEQAESKDLDFSTLIPKGPTDTPSIWIKKVVLTEKDIQRNIQASERLTKLVLRSKGENTSTNLTILKDLAARNYEAVKKLYGATALWAIVPSLDAFNAILISLTLLADAEEFDEALRKLIISRWKMNSTSYFILVEHYCKTQEWAFARMYFGNLVNELELRFELAMEAYDVAIETGKPVPEGVEPPFYNFYKECAFESLDELKLALHYYVLTISANAGRAGPLTRRRTLEALTKQWSVTQVGKASPFLGIEELLKAEKDIVNQYEQKQE
jgi:hypothetical protein